jgi:membrane-bound lytic murein transglycosylase MltF
MASHGAAGWRWLACVGGLGVLMGATALAGPLPARIDRYDNSFRKYTKRFFGPGFDWRLFKAQAMAESGVEPQVKSREGAVGVMQLLPSTFGGVTSKYPELQTIDDPDCNIGAGISYDRELWNYYPTVADEGHRQRFMFASYNAGPATLQRAQQLARQRALDDRIWGSIEAVASAVPRWRYAETFGYLKRIGSNAVLLGCPVK